jgi:hypothetical protein
MRKATVEHGDAAGEIELADQRERCSLRLSAASAAMNNGDGARGHVEMVPGGECASDIELASFVLSHVVLLLSARPARAVVFAGPLILDAGAMLSNIICLGVHQAVMWFLGHLGHDWVMDRARMTHEREP